MYLARIHQGVSLLLLLVAIIIGHGCSAGADDAQEPSSNSETINELSVAQVSDANVALAEGIRLFDENQTEKAIEFLEHAVALNPDLAEGHFRLGIAYSLLEMQYEQEGVITETAANTNSKSTKKRSERSFERAVEAYKKWVDANPKDDLAYFNLGRTYSKIMKDEEAEEAFEKAVELKPEDTEYQTELGAILVKLAKYHEAIKPLKKAIELDPENVRAEELLEDAQAGRQRIDYVSKPDANKAASNRASNSNTLADGNSNADSPPRTTNSNLKQPPVPPKKPTPSVNRSN